MGVSQFVKGQGVVLMPLQSEYVFQDCEHGECQHVIDNGFTDSKGMLYRSSQPPPNSNTTLIQLYFPLHHHIFIPSQHQSPYKAPHISRHSQQRTMLYYVHPLSDLWTTS